MTDFAFEIASSDPFYETEYDGRTYTYCFFCDCQDGAHSEGCLYVKATQCESWQKHLTETEAVTKKERNKEGERLKRLAWRKEIVTCGICEKRVSRQGLEGHKNNNKKCKKILLAANLTS